jgi:16S rRNA (uracil1498-N3)-methyltransferase
MSTSPYVFGKRTIFMSQTRLYIDQLIRANTALEIGGDRAHYIGRVLRLRVGDQLTLFDGKGGEYPAQIESISKQSVQVAIGDHIDADHESHLSIHLLQGLSRGDRIDMVVQKATELGVSAMTPVITDYSVVKLSGERALKKLAHWRGICTSACEQCGRNVLPRIEQPARFRDWLGANVSDTQARLILKPNAPDTLRSCTNLVGPVKVLIGPEGGFSEAEYRLAADTGFKTVSLGPRILRTETAALAAVAGLQTLFGDLDGDSTSQV